MVKPPSFLAAAFDRDIKIKEERPRVTLTFAQSLDAKIAGVDGKQLILSGKESMVMTHWMRTMHDGILIGVGTALNDDPQLNKGKGKQPWVIHSKTEDGEVLERKKKLESAGARIIESEDNAVCGVLYTLRSLGVRSLMVEGGAQIIDSFARSGKVDRLVVTVAPVVVGPLGIGYTLDPDSLAGLSFQASERMGNDHVIIFESQ